MDVDTDTDLHGDEVDLEQVEAEAKTLGWVPEEEFKGRKDHWVDAETFLERGKQLMPILRQNNKKLQADLKKRDAAVGELSEQVTNLNTALERMEKHLTQASKQKVTDAKTSLKAAIKEARESNDVDRELELREEYDAALAEEKRILDEEAAANKREKEPKKDKGPDLNAEVQEFLDDQPWFSNPENTEDRKRAKAFSRFCEDLREEGSKLVGREFLDEALRQFEEGEEEPAAPPKRKAGKIDTGETTRRPASQNNSAGKSFNSLPKEARDACMSFADDLVGPNKRYKTLADWQKKYTKDYYESEE